MANSTPNADPVFNGASVREEAAALYASGANSAAEDLLLSYITKCRGTCPRSVWFMILDIYQATGQKTAFEKIAQFFASHFDTSPPAWLDRTSPSVRGGSGGLNALVVDGPLHAMSVEKVRQFIFQARRSQTARLDLSRSRLPDGEQERINGLRGVLDVLRALRRHRVPTLLMGETQLAEQMRMKVSGQIQGRMAADEEGKLSWQMLLEFLQWRGQEEAFDELADAYAAKFLESPPDYEKDGVVAVAPDDRSPGIRAADPTETVALPAVVDIAKFDEILPMLNEVLDRHDHLRLDLRHTDRVSYEAGVALAAFLHARSLPTGVTLFQPSELVLALLDMTGVCAFASVVPRKA